jgi:hypothetical protein
LDRPRFAQEIRMILPVRARRVATTLFTLAVLTPGCARNITAPTPPASIHRTVTVTLLDSLGAPVVDQQVTIIALVDSAGTVSTSFGRTDANGNARFVLRDGPWAAASEPLTVATPPARHRVAGTTFVVAGASRPAADTVRVPLRLATASRVTGTTTLAGRADYHGIIVSTEALLYPFATSDALGHWTLEDLPPGTWNITMFQLGYGMVTRPVVVPAPGSTVVMPPVQMH